MPFTESNFWRGGFDFNSKRRKGQIKEGFTEPRSVLDHRSPSPPTSTSTLSSSLGGGGGGGGGGSSDTAGGVPAAVSDGNPTPKWPQSEEGGGASRKEEWASELQPIPAGLEMGDKCSLGGVEDWEAMLSDSAASPGQDQSFLHWIMGEIDDPSAAGGMKHQGSVDPGLGFGLVDPGFGFEPVPASTFSPPPPPLATSSASNCGGFESNNNPVFPQPLPPPGVFFQEQPMEEKPLLFTPSFLLNQHQQLHPQNPSFFLSLPSFETQQASPNLLPPQPKRHQSSILDLPSHFPQKTHFPEFRNQNQNQSFPQLNAVPFQFQQALVDQLFKAAEFIEAGNSISARGILARLNHQLPSPSGKPLFRSAFYFKEALLLLTNNSPNPIPQSSNSPLSTPLDVLTKLGTYKAFSEISPVLQFTNFTCIQALLEELNGSDRIHIVDFDVGVGGHWSSFMQELAQRWSTATGATPLLKITAFTSPGSHHPFEIHLTRENLSHFAAHLNIPFEFNILSLDSFDPSMILSMSAAADEAIAVNFPTGSGYHSSIPTLLRLVKQLNPKIVVSVDHGCDRSDLPFSHHFLHAFQSCTVLLDSIDASGASSDVANKIERYLVQPRIESAVLGRHRLAPDKMLPWRSVFDSAGFVQVQFSNFTETQAECLLRRVHVRGFQVEKRQASLFLCWQRGELVSVSAWRC